MRDDKKQPLTLDTIIASYKSKDPQQADVQVDLIGAVHVGDKTYYDQLNKQFEQYDALLFELVAPKDIKIPKDRPKGPTSAIGAMQVGMKEALDWIINSIASITRKLISCMPICRPKNFPKLWINVVKAFQNVFSRHGLWYVASIQSGWHGIQNAIVLVFQESRESAQARHGRSIR